MKTTKKVSEKIVNIVNLEDKGLAIVGVGMTIALLFFLSGLSPEPAKSIILATSFILTLICISVVLATIIFSLLVVTPCVIWDVLSFTKDSVHKYGFLTVLLKVLALVFLIGSSYVLFQAFQPGTGLHIVFRTEQPNPFLVIGSFMAISLFVLIKKL